VVQDRAVAGNLPLLGTDRVERHPLTAIDDEHGGSLSQAGHPADHVVGIEDAVVSVGQYGKWIRILTSELGDAFGLVGGDGNDLGTAGSELLDVLSQLRQVPLAEWSAEAPQEDKDDGSLGQELREPVASTGGIGKLKVRRS
jgi:hypothetical protein